MQFMTHVVAEIQFVDGDNVSDENQGELRKASRGRASEGSAASLPQNN